MKKIYCATWDSDCVMGDDNYETTYWYHEENIKSYYTKLLKRIDNIDLLRAIIDEYNDVFESNDDSIDELIDKYIKTFLKIYEITCEDEE